MKKPTEVLFLDYEDGRVGITQLFCDPTAEKIRETIGKMARQPVSWRRGSLDDIPKDRDFRDAWAHDGAGKVDIDMPKARDIQRNRLREARKPLLEALDVEAMLAVEERSDAKITEVQKKKQKLRDITADPRIEAAKTPDDLKDIKIGS